MYACPNCGSGLRFDIPSQRLKCDHCQTNMDPYDYEKAHDAEENKDTFAATIYQCPQCGGEIYTTDDSATGFCSYCGAHTVLDGRLTQMTRPEYILPFKKNKQECIALYSEAVKKAFLTPKEFKNPRYLEEFRGIYMPYWVYNMTIGADLAFTAKKTHREGDYRVTEEYRLTCQVDGFYNGISYDAASTFEDPISETIAPFNAREIKLFTPSFMCGFYADLADVDSGVYLDDAAHLMEDDIVSNVTRANAFARFSCSSEARNSVQNRIVKSVNSTNTQVNSALFPVWFLAYRNNGRVAYAVVNGSNGRVYCDLPIARWKFALLSLIIAVPMFFLLNMFLTLNPTTGLLVAGLLAVITEGICNKNVKAIYNRETGSVDQGIQDARAKAQGIENGKKEDKRGTKTFRTNAMLGSGSTPNKGVESAVGVILLFLLGAFIGVPILDSLNTYGGLILGVLTIIFLVGSISAAKLPVKCGKNYFTLFSTPVAALFAAVILFAHPVDDVIYYIGSAGVFTAVALALVGLINQFNILATRPLPQLNRKGGDTRAGSY